jgi:DNA-binding response OmpR family regulator
MKIQPTILVADDHEDIRDLVAFRLNRAGYNVITAVDGLQAFELAKENIPDLILLDIRMPKMTGLEVTHALRQEPSTSHIPIILLTASVGEDAVSIGFDSGADDYIKKPFVLSELMARVQAILARR